MYQYLTDSQKNKLFVSVVSVFALLALFLGVKVVNTMKEYNYIGQGTYAPNVITVNGTGEVLAVPDVATFSFSVVESAKDLPTAQDMASKKSNSILVTLKGLGVMEKDIKTTGYSSYLKYEWQNEVCKLSAANSYCPQGKNVLIGYEISETFTVKVRKVSDSGNILSKVGLMQVQNISGLNFVIDDTEKIKIEARDKAIQNAKDKAKVLEKSLGISLGHIVNFYENDGGGMPIYASYMSMDKGMSAEATPPVIPTGENKFISSVSIAYEVK